MFLQNQHRFHNPGQFPFFSAHLGPQSLQQSPAIVLVRQEVVDEVVDEEGEEVVVVLIEPSSPLLSSVVASSQLADVEHFTFTCSGFAIVSQLCFAIDAS